MSSNTIGPLPKKYDNLGEKVRKASGDLNNIKKELITTIVTVVKKGTTDMVDKKVKQNLMWWRKPLIIPFHQKED